MAELVSQLDRAYEANSISFNFLTLLLNEKYSIFFLIFLCWNIFLYTQSANNKVAISVSSLNRFTKIMRQSFITAWQKHHLRKDIITKRGLSYMSNIKMTLNCRNMSKILQVLIKFQPSNRALSEKYTETQN